MTQACFRFFFLNVTQVIDPTEKKWLIHEQTRRKKEKPPENNG